MLLTELIEIVITETGQFIVGESLTSVLDCSNISKDRFWLIAKKSLYEFQKHKPVTQIHNVNVTVSPYEFIVGTNPTPDPIPKWISSVKPTGITEGVIIREALFPISELEPRTFLWEYRNPFLYVSETGYMEITAQYEYTVNTTLNTTTDTIEEVDIVEMTDRDDRFINLTIANFMIALGRSRRQFNLPELSVELDASDLVEEGKELLQTTRESFEEDSKWWESIGI